MSTVETVSIDMGIEEIFIDKVKQAPEKPEPPIITNLTHHSIDCQWKHVKDKLPKNQKYKFILQGSSQNRNKGEWNLLYNGFGVTKNVVGLEPSTEFFFRLIVVSPKKVESEPSERVCITTESMLLFLLLFFVYCLVKIIKKPIYLLRGATEWRCSA